MDPRLRELAQQLLLAVTDAEAIEEAVLVLMTDAAADTAAQVISAAEQLAPMLEQGPGAQAEILASSIACQSPNFRSACQSSSFGHTPINTLPSCFSII